MPSAAELIAKRLADAGCRNAFGIPGGEVLAIMDALERANIRVVLAKHENCAGFMGEGVYHHDGAPAILVRPDLTVRIRNILAALISAADMDGVQGPPGWRIHPLSGDRAGTWSISASGNWRITFDIEDGIISNLDLEDYH